MRNEVPVTIANGGSQSTVATLPVGENLVGLSIETALTATADTITFETQLADRSTWVKIKQPSSMTNYSIAAVASQCHIPIDINIFRGINTLRIVASGNQTGSKTITLITDRI